MSAILTRRALFGATGKVVAVAALAGLPAFASGAPSRATWNAAVARLEAADAAHLDYGVRVVEPTDEQYDVEQRLMPSFAMAADYGPDAKRPRSKTLSEDGKPIVWSESIIRQFADPKYDAEASSLAMFAQEMMPEVDAVDAHNTVLRIRLGLDEKADEFDRLVGVWCERRKEVFTMPAPDWAALTYKLKLLSEHPHLASDEGDHDPLPVITVDAERLLRGPLS